jgi:hypothetical protein
VQLTGTIVRPPSFVLTPSVKDFSVRNEIKLLLCCQVCIRATGAAFARVPTAWLTKRSLHQNTFYSKSDNPVKAESPDKHFTPRISLSHAINAKQTRAELSSPGGPLNSVLVLLFLVTMASCRKSQIIFRINSPYWWSVQGLAGLTEC